MTSSQIEDNLKKLLENWQKETFVYDFLLAYGLPKSSITRLQKGNLNLSKEEGELSWKKKVLFKEVFEADLHLAITDLITKAKHEQRFIIATDYVTFLAIDTKTQDKLDIPFLELPQYFDFFLPWAGMEKTQYQSENPADVKAAGKMAKLFDEIKKDNPDNSPEFIHGLNVFLSRLLFCFFGEDTGIFSEGKFTNTIASHTQEDGSDLDDFLNKLFKALNTPEKQREGLPNYLNEFPYVNGGLFSTEINAPVFTRKSRQAIINSGELQWKDINPDIFGSMFQAVIDTDQRGNMGQHYTSVPNIMKVIEPLFLNELYEELEAANTKGPVSAADKKKLLALLKRIWNIKVFDPACGSGNFLIIAYKELRRLEMTIFKALGNLALSEIHLSNFYGIELDDFAHEIAQLSLWLAEHQMNNEFFREFGRTNPTLPLKEAGKIVRGNACRLDWEQVCPKTKDSEIYILGNPPYLGYARQSSLQKEDMKFVFKGINEFKKLDFIACWFFKARNFIESINSKFAFVSTNSITQGEQVSLLWPLVLKNSLEIFFAFRSFKWVNNAIGNAGVSVVIIGLQNKSFGKKYIFSKHKKIESLNINPYLTSNSEVIVTPRSTNISKLRKMIKGSSPGDNGHLLLKNTEYDSIVSEYPHARKFLFRYVGAKEFMYDEKRYCIWVEEEDYNEAIEIEEFRSRFELVKSFRLTSKKEATREKASKPYLFDERKFNKTSSILIPQTGSERREYLPVGFCNDATIVSNAARLINNAEPWLFGILSSIFHIIWIKAIAGRLKMDMQYSNTLCYNTFPFPPITEQRKQEITQCVFRILEEREKHPGKTLAQLYDPDKMPDGLREAHHANDMAIERCYRSRPFESDEERLEYLFKLYEQMLAEENDKNTLFEKKTKKRR